MINLSSEDDVKGLVFIDDRKFTVFYAKLAKHVKDNGPSTIMSIGLRTNGFPYAFVMTGATETAPVKKGPGRPPNTEPKNP